MKGSKDKMIAVGPDYAIQGDTYCLTLFRRRIVKKTGQVQYDAVAYFDCYRNLFDRLVDIDINPINNLQDIANRITELKQWITDTCRNL